MTTERPPVEDLLRITFAELPQAPGPGRRREPLRAGSRTAAGAIALLEGLMKRYPHVLAIGQELVLALLECHEEEQAEAVLCQLDRSFTNLDEETQCRWGRLFKDQGDAYVRLPWSDPDGRPADPEMARVFYRKSLERYDQAYRIRSGHYPGINKATLLLILGTLQPPIAGAPCEGDRGIRGTRRGPACRPHAGRRGSRRTRPSGIRRPPARPTCCAASGTPPPSNMATPSRAGTSTLTPAWPCTGRWNASACASRSSGSRFPRRSATRRRSSRRDWRRSRWTEHEPSVRLSGRRTATGQLGENP